MVEKPAEWLIEYAADNDYSTDLKDWKYEGKFWEPPDPRPCTHKKGLRGEPTFIPMFAITHTNESLYGIGNCEVCGKVLWCEVVPRK